MSKVLFNAEENYYIDKNGNRFYANIEKFNTEEKAIAASESLIKCTNCYNCNDCNDCYNCNDCNDCTNCIDCYSCTNCIDCYGCNDCNDCYSCNDCNDCNNAQPLTF
jgi:hypothetical protein